MSASVRLLLVLVLTAGVWCSGLPGHWVLDDTLFVVGNPYLQMESLSWASVQEVWESGRRWPLHRFPAMFTFALQNWSGFNDPAAHRVVNIGLHLAGGVLVYWLTVSLLAWRSGAGEAQAVPPANDARPGLANCDSHGLALMVAAIWLLHPLQASTVLYPFQRVTQCSALAVLATLLVYVRLRMASLAGRRSMVAPAAVLVLGTLMAALCKENGILLPLYALVLELTCFRFRGSDGRRNAWLMAFFLAVAVLPLLAATAWYLLPEVVERRYAGRDFTLTERVLTEWRVLCFYLSLVLWPDIRRMGIFHDDFTLSTGLLQPASTLLAGLALAGLLALAWWLRKRAPLAAFGILLWLASHYLESTFMSLELVFEHRNYLGLVGLALAAAALLEHAVARRAMRTVLATVLIAALAIAAGVRARDWSTDNRLYEAEVAHHPASPRALMGLASRLVSVEQNGSGARRADALLVRAAAADPGAVRPWAMRCRVAALSGASIEALWVEAMASRLFSPPSHQEKHHALGMLARCAVADCRPQAQVLRPAFDAAMASTVFRPSQRRKVLEYAALYYADAIGELPVALAALEEAVSLQPEEARPRLNLAHLQLRAGRLDEARASLAEARARDRYGHLAAPIEQLAREMEEVSSSPLPAPEQPEP